MPQGHISRFEKGQYVAINPEKLVAIAKALEVSTDWLLGLTSEVEGNPKHS
jgi:transcriptional regulator with XRE-family HTH domain